MNNTNLAKRILPLLDLTSLNETDDDTVIKKLCAQATTSVGSVAAVCVYPKFVALVKQCLTDPNIKIAAVSNFPAGNNSIVTTLLEIKQAIAAGANEIDVVMPYHDYLQGKITATKDFIATCKAACGSNVLLKVILETGALIEPEIIAPASKDVIEAGADFIKTSTGKIAIGATLAAAKTMLEVIHNLNLKRTVGFKTSGGVRTLEQAATYLELADTLMGKNWVSPHTFRIGASSLLAEVVKNLQ